VRCLKCGMVGDQEEMEHHKCPPEGMTWKAHWSIRMGGAHHMGDTGSCKRCGHALRTSTSYDERPAATFSDEIVLEIPEGHVCFDGCVWCLAETIAGLTSR